MNRLVAVQYRQTLTSGHSRPCLIDAETLEGDRQEVVMKLRESITGAERGLARELVASVLASRLGLNVPSPCLVELTAEFAESIQPPDVRTRMLANLGTQFGTIQLTGSWHAVPFTRNLPDRLFETAASIFAFDALVRNDDRHLEKANYLMRGNTVMLIDHERAFPEQGMVAGPMPWEAGGLSFLTKHVFFPGLKGQLPDFDPVLGAFESITPAEFAGMVAAIPDEWESGGVAAEVEGYLVAASKNLRKIKTSLATIIR
jgi:hypothetical protein